MRVIDHPVLGKMNNRKHVQFRFNGHSYSGMEGEPIAAALLAHGVRTLRCTEREGKPRGIYCGIGHCYECRVTVDGIPSVRACVTPVREGMNIESQGCCSDES